MENSPQYRLRRFWFFCSSLLWVCIWRSQVYSGFNSKILYLGSSSSCLIQICFPRSNSSCCCRVPISSMLGGLVYQKTFL
ncbi:hypothetical protein MRB53_031884 [Persea americana]|uniref:Uncharacterized protein n=1 Tax=Persea americana TaxID=3435 RepID=A0ACC2KQB7_PERAE|nr:hypothetical protein MRB53_031884 [Persea americana]